MKKDRPKTAVANKKEVLDKIGKNLLKKLPAKLENSKSLKKLKESPLKSRPATSKENTMVKMSSSPKKKAMKNNFVENLKKMLEEDLAKDESPPKIKKIKPKIPKADKIVEKSSDKS